MSKKLKYPVGVQSFELIRTGGYVYIDKTEVIHNLVSSGSYYFLGRPRRFGKSLLISTLEAYFQGRKELFQGLAIERLEANEWTSFPVVRIDLSGQNFHSPGEFTNYMKGYLEDIEHRHGLNIHADDISTKFRRLVQSLHSQYGKKVVILIDEYDSPLTRNVSNQELQELVREEMQGFYSGIKPLSEHIHFCMLTGVTKYGKLSIFSTLNNLDDISFDEAYSEICGITEAELHTYLDAGMNRLAEKYEISLPSAYDRLKDFYDGYHFSEKLIDIYNPFSVMSALSKERLGEYWFETGTPAMLVDFLRNPQKEIPELSGIRVRRETISNISLFQPQFVALLYQTGYLTIKDYDPERDRYILDFPNREVKSGFFSSLLPIYTRLQRSETDSVSENILDAILDGEPEKLIACLTTFLASIPSELHKHTTKYESHYQLILYLLFRLIGTSVSVEYQTSDGFIDILIKTDRFIYLMELKVDGTAAVALAQIEEKGYYLPFATDPRTLFRIGLSFDSKTKKITDYLIW
ncbi:MAG: ATP-binding protein [Muribaculaceae bacterium]|nr:ATP-binding protein [Muribaculaceae bacterium]